MSEEPKKLSLRDTIIPKSDQLNYDDVATAPITVRITGLLAGTPEQPVIVKIEGDRVYQPYKPCKSMRRVMIAAWGDKGKDWIGKSMTLYGDHGVKFGGVEMGGIRISHVSGISEPLRVKLTASRGKRADCTILPLGRPAAPQDIPDALL